MTNCSGFSIDYKPAGLGHLLPSKSKLAGNGLLRLRLNTVRRFLWADCGKNAEATFRICKLSNGINRTHKASREFDLWQPSGAQARTPAKDSKT